MNSDGVTDIQQMINGRRLGPLRARKLKTRVGIKCVVFQRSVNEKRRKRPVSVATGSSCLPMTQSMTSLVAFTAVALVSRDVLRHAVNVGSDVTSTGYVMSAGDDTRKTSDQEVIMNTVCYGEVLRC